MDDWTFARGALPALVNEKVVIVLAGNAAEEWARILLPILPEIESPERVVEHFAATGDVSGIPSFFVGSVNEGSLRCIVRGAFRIETRMQHGETLTIEGSSARTWSEMTLEDVALSTVTLPGVIPAPELRPLRPGPHSVGSLRFEPARVASSEPNPVPTPAAEKPSPIVSVGDTLAEDTLPPREQLIDPPAPPVRASAGTYDSLFGSVTIVGSIEDAAVREHESGIIISDGPGGVDPLFDSREAALSALVCPQHHPNPPSRTRCWRCAEPLGGSPVVRVARPVLGELAFDDGRVIALARTILIGRSPRPDRTDGSGIPELVVVASPNNDVSRTHARVFLDGWQVLIEDLGSTNGTMVIDRGGESRRIRSGEPAILVDGTRIDLGDGVRFTAVGVP